MTDPAMHDPEQNFAYYRHNTGYEKNDARFQEPRIRWLRRRLVGAKSVLDLGANDGFVAEICPEDCAYAGIELNLLATTNAYPRAQGVITNANIVTFPYENLGQVDAIVVAEVLEHLPDPLTFLQEIRAALKPDGKLLTTSPVGPGARIEPGNKDHLREWTGAEYRKLHEDAGYRLTYYGMEPVYWGRLTHCIEARLS